MCNFYSIGNSAISIIGITGKESLQIAKKYFSSKTLNYKEIKPRYVYLGDFQVEDFQENV